MGGLTRGSRRLVWLLVAVVVPPALTLAWLGFALLRHDHTMLAQRLTEARQRAAEAAVRVFERELAAIEGSPSSDPPPDGLVRLTLEPERLRVAPAGALQWWPVMPTLREAASTPFAEAELLEFRGQPTGALAMYRPLTRSPDRPTRAGAWLRVARVHRAAERWEAALAAYDQLAAFDDVAVAGVAASLQARRAAIATLGDAGRPEARLAAATALGRDLAGGRWRTDRDTWDLAWSDVTAAGAPPAEDAERRLVSLVANALWHERGVRPQLRAAFAFDSATVTVLPTRDDDRAVMVVLPVTLERWRGAAMREARVASLEIVVEGPAVAPPRERAGLSIVNAAVSGLPWTLTVGAPDQTALVRDLANRRWLLVAGLLAMLALLAGGSYFLWRVVDRELAVARLKAGFVAAVSHEFRTPLTSLRHIAELLEEDDTMAESSRREFYRALGRNTERLQRLVESLLDFARLDAGRRPYDLQRLDPGPWAEAVVEAFRREQATSGVRVEVEARSGAGEVLADRTALGNALWNLLDNAVKYSPRHTPVRVSVTPHPRGVAIAVEDRGLGVPPAEREEIFERFVRGTQVRQLGITGTGLGLAMVQHIVAAHGGEVELESEEGVGSTFRMVLPAAG